MIEAVTIGVIFGAALTGLMWWLSDISYRAWLIRKADLRQHVEIDKRLFFVVPEHEYVRPIDHHDDHDHYFKPGPEHDKDIFGRPLKPGS